MNKQNKLKYYRMKQEFSQSDVAEKLNISRQSISNWENSKTEPDVESLKILSQLYKVSIDELLDNTHISSHDSKFLSKLNLEYILVFIVALLFVFTFFITAPYGVIGAVVLLIYNNNRIKSKLIISLCILIMILNLLHFILFLLL